MSKKKGHQALSTMAIHGGAETRHAGDPVVAPLVQSVNYVQEVGTGAGLKYTRYGNTPNAERIQKRIAMLEGAEASLVLSSGMGATACAMLALLRPGDHLLASSFIYGGTHRLLMEDLCLQGLERIGRGGGPAASGRAREPMLLDPDMIEGQPAAKDKDRGEQQRHPGQRRPAADHRRNECDHDRDTPGPALQQAQLARGEPAPILRRQSPA